MNLYTPDELRSKISSNEYGAELCLQHAMANIAALEHQVTDFRDIAKELARSLEQMVIVMKMEGINHKDYDLLGIAVNSALAKYKALTHEA